jgi:hypothetical protein
MSLSYEGGRGAQECLAVLNKTADPRLSMLRRFAKAMGVDVRELLGEG